MSSPPEVWRSSVTRSRGGTVTVSSWATGTGPFTWTESWVCVPGGTGTRTVPRPGAALLSRYFPPSDTTKRLRARTSRPSAPLPGASRMVAVLDAADSVHATLGLACAAASARWPIHATTRPSPTSVPAAARKRPCIPLTTPQGHTFACRITSATRYCGAVGNARRRRVSVAAATLTRQGHRSHRLLVGAEHQHRQRRDRDGEYRQAAALDGHPGPVGVRAHRRAPRFQRPVERVAVRHHAHPVRHQRLGHERGGQEREREQQERVDPDDRLPLPGQHADRVGERAEHD